MDSVTFTDPIITTASKSFVFAKINADEQNDLAKRYGVSGFPTMVITKPNGMEVERLVGYYPPEEFIPAMLDLLTNRYTLDALLSTSIEYPDSLQLLYDIADSYSYRSMNDQAVYYYNKIIERDPENKQGVSDDSWLSLASIERKNDEVEKAVEMYQQLEEKFPESDLIEMSHLMIPYTYHRAEDYKKAEKHYKKFLEDYPESENAEWVNKQLDKIKEDKKKK